jgi:hypothetical protein
MKKNCTICDQLKNIDEFPKCNACKDGYRNQCKDCIRDRQLKWSQDNPEYHRNWVSLNKEKDTERKLNHYNQNKEVYIQRSTDYRKENKDKVNKLVSQYRKKRFSEDEVFKLTFTVRSRLRNFLKLSGGIKKDTTFDLIGCTPQELVKHIENQFTDGMSWDNHGEWHIDHIVPLSTADNYDDLKRLSHYSNLQPLWAKDNLSKSNKTL